MKQNEPSKYGVKQPSFNRIWVKELGLRLIKFSKDLLNDFKFFNVLSCQIIW